MCLRLEREGNIRSLMSLLVVLSSFSSLTLLNFAYCNFSFFHSSSYYLLPYISVSFFLFFSSCLLHLVSFLVSLVALCFLHSFVHFYYFYFLLRFSSSSLIFFCCLSSLPLSLSFSSLLSVLLQYSPVRSTSTLLNIVLHPSPIRSETPSSRIAAASSAYRSHDIT